MSNNTSQDIPFQPEDDLLDDEGEGDTLTVHTTHIEQDRNESPFEDPDREPTPDPDHPENPIRGPQRIIRRRDFAVTFWQERFPVERLQKYKERIRYAVFQKEKCPTTGRIHWQTYIEFRTPQYVNFVKDNIFKDPTCHVQFRKGANSRIKCRYYCMKTRTRVPGTESGPFEFGNWVKDGQRTDLDKVKESLEDGMSVADIMEENFKTCVRIPHALKIYQEAQCRKDSMAERNVIVNVYYGPTGTGKTRAAMDEAMKLVGGDFAKLFSLGQPRVPGGCIWFDGYQSGPVLVIDDYYDWIDTTLFLKILDRYPIRLEQKGGIVYANWTHVWITSNFHPTEWKTPKGKPIDPRSFKPLLRRINNISYFPKLGVRIDNVSQEQAQHFADEMNEE